jgi:hypothetical protein
MRFNVEFFSELQNQVQNNFMATVSGAVLVKQPNESQLRRDESL